MIPSKKEIEEFKNKFEAIYQATVVEHPEIKRLNERVNDLLKANTQLVLENRELRDQRNEAIDALARKDDFIRGSIRHIAPPTMKDVEEAQRKREVPLELADD